MHVHGAGIQQCACGQWHSRAAALNQSQQNPTVWLLSALQRRHAVQPLCSCMTALKPHTSWACRVLACIGVLLLVRAQLPSQSLDPGRVLLPSRRHLLVDAAGELGADTNKGRPDWVV